MAQKVIDFPACEETKQKRLSGLVEVLAEHYEAEVGIETVSIVRVTYDDKCPELDTILKELAGDPAGIKVKRVRGPSKHGKSISLNGSRLERGIDPLGS